MKTKLTIVLLFISTILFAQQNNEKSNEKVKSKIKKITNGINIKKAVFVKIGDIKGESTTKSKNKTNKRGELLKNTNKKSNARYYNKRKFNEELLEQRKTKRRRVEVLKSNKTGDPNKPKKS